MSCERRRGGMERRFAMLLVELEGRFLMSMFLASFCFKCYDTLVVTRVDWVSESTSPSQCA